MKIWYVYKITNLLTGKSYVGQKHNKIIIDPLKDNYMGSGKYLKSSIKKHGKENFKKEILIEGLTTQFAANIFEEYFIKKEETLFPNGYNLVCSCNQKGLKHSEVTKQKMRESHKNISIETRLKLSIASKKSSGNRGKKLSEEKRIKKSLARKGFKHSNETRLKMSESRKGMTQSEETKKKISETKTGKKASIETKLKLSIAAKKKPKISEETREKISQSKQGKKRGPNKKPL
jgi:hypothetical protein